MGQRSSHFQIIPLCQEHHMGKTGIHGMGRKAFEKAYLTEIELLERVRECLLVQNASKLSK